MSFRTGPLVLFYNSYFGSWPNTLKLNWETTCRFTTDRGRLAEAALVVFHLPTMRREDYPRRHPGQRWAAWSMESRANIPELNDPRFMSQFDITMGYWRGATVWTGYFSGDTLKPLKSPPVQKTEAAPLVYFQSSRLDRSGRMGLVRALMARIQVDSYGKVLNSRRLVGPDRGIQTKLATIARYKFTLALENSIEDDYVTEKFFQPLIAGSVPVYLGAPNIADFAPGERCFINAADFDGPESLARFLQGLCEDEAAYAEYLAWKDRPLRPQFLDLVRSMGSWSMYRLSAAAHGSRPGAGVPHDGLSSIGRLTSRPPFRAALKTWRPLLRRLLTPRAPSGR